ncbi:Formate--tetrahydrofolate ligase [Salinivirga cyanobacteriivorans]|uniref:Formate--tetrahydrofolate ligase n=1 Tax=Salinivirga cyanobacteriivorans TaxID=1307839 RepID=A0A0S2I3L9_9BACT|nr:formate--tetrahydrofolate ligase [Salinivirga cyanobacteriivorans]ALO16958.1 Formate--tetrahydrofolate ligase [Salinivirga cyanobacteriivorans]
MKSDIQIANEAKIQPITDIGSKLGIDSKDLELYGNYKAKVPLNYIDPEKVKKNNLILVSAISPTPAGEGKTTISIGLSQGLNHIGADSSVVLREPSLGPVFGIKGGATGGGMSQVLPMEDINLHFTGDFAAIEKAHNLLAAMIDNAVQHRTLNIDPRTVLWKRVMDMNDRSLRNSIVGLGGRTSGFPRETGFDITAASEIMAILCLAEDFKDLKERIGNIFIGYTFDKKPVYARDLKAHGAMAALLRDAIKPNLVQTLENTPAFIHGGPFANIAQGTNSVIATKMGMSLSDYVVTEAGFGFDLGAEKFFDIKCQSSGLSPKAVVLVATARALKYHGGADLDKVNEPNMEALKAGISNLEKHLENIQAFNVCAVVAINKFATDTDEELEYIKKRTEDRGIKAVVADVWGQGGKGAEDLATEVKAVVDQCENKFKPMYDWEWDIPKKIETVAKNIYGAAAIDYTSRAKADLKKIKELGLDNLPVCIAKTQKSLSDNPKLIGRPKDFVVTVREIELSSGAGFVVPITGKIMRMPGLPKAPSAEKIDVDDDGNISGLF